MKVKENRIAKPLYFYRRWRSANTPCKRAYYAVRLLHDFNVDVDTHEVVTASEGRMLLAEDLVEGICVLHERSY